MKKASEYRQHAAECRQLANRMGVGEHRDQLLDMAATWDALAKEREALVRRHPELAQDGEGVAAPKQPVIPAAGPRSGPESRDPASTT